jgi:hypothetical protein
MGDIAWEMTECVETSASPEFAWKYWTTVANWSDPPAEFELNGPFETGSHGFTRLPGQEPIEWLLREVTPPSTATIELALAGAVLFFEWRFEGLSTGRTRISQRVVLEGQSADTYLSKVASSFSRNLPDGMSKIARAMAEAQSRQTDKAV